MCVCMYIVWNRYQLHRNLLLLNSSVKDCKHGYQTIARDDEGVEQKMVA